MRRLIPLIPFFILVYSFPIQALYDNPAPSRKEELFSPTKTTHTGTQRCQGALCHFALYPDKCIVTFLDGKKKDTQIIIAHGAVKEVSRIERPLIHGFLHEYPWGQVVTYHNKQEIVAKKPKK